jgi:hypothetical protein
MRHRAADLVEGLLDVAGDREDVARVAKAHLFAQVHPDLVVVRGVERGDLAHPLRSEAGAGAVGGAAVERRAEDGGVVVADLGHVLGIGGFQEGVDAGVVGELAAREGRNRSVLDRVGGGEAHAERPSLFLLPFRAGNGFLRPGGAPAEELRQVGVVEAPVLAPAGAARAGALTRGEEHGSPP